MFGFFEKSLHEPVASQREEILLCDYPDEFKRLLIEGADCDELSGATAEFGHRPRNPIPVNDLIGTYKNFARFAPAAGNREYITQLYELAKQKYGEDAFSTKMLKLQLDNMKWKKPPAHSVFYIGSRSGKATDNNNRE